MSSRRSEKSRGAALVEVMFAVALTAVTVLGLIAAQLWTARQAHAVSMREQAAFVADSVVEAAHATADGAAGLAQWKARAASLLPRGDASVSELGGGIFVARVTWAAAESAAGPLGAGGMIDARESCGGAAVPANMSCVAIAFAK
jgi:Tfp pilus assembly protein PilV